MLLSEMNTEFGTDFTGLDIQIESDNDLIHWERLASAFLVSISSGAFLMLACRAWFDFWTGYLGRKLLDDSRNLTASGSGAKRFCGRANTLPIVCKL
jgi:hypothetical protein